MRGRISPAAVRTEKESCSVQPLRRRYMTAWRTPLPDSSASRAVGVVDAELGDEAALVGLAQQQDAVGADAGVRRAEAPDRSGVSSKGSSRSLDDRVVVAERLPLLEAHGGAP